MLRSKQYCRIPEVPYHEAVFFNVRNHDDKVAVVMGNERGKTLTYKQLYRAMVSVGSALNKLGIKKGDVVALYLPNCLEFLLGLLGVASIGGVVTAFNSKYSAYEIEHPLSDSNAKTILTISDNVRHVKQVINEEKSKTNIKHIITVDERVPGCLYFGDFLCDDGLAFPSGLTFNVREDLAMIMYSSGTTGLPKGVMLTHYNLTVMLMIFIDPSRIPPSTPNEEVTILLYLPLFHLFAISIVLPTFHLGNKLVLLDGFKPREFLNALQEHKVNRLYVVPPTVSFLVKSPLVDEYDLSSINMVTCSAAPLISSVEDGLKSRLKLDMIYQGYGMTEMSAFIAMAPWGKGKSGSSGQLCLNTTAKVVDGDSGKLLSCNEVGEIYLHGSSRMKGYLNRPEANAEAIDKDGWLRTGDIGYYDEDGYVFITGRVKELIKYKGFQVAPAELEGLIIKHPGVVDVAVIGLPDSVSGELPRAFIVRQKDHEVTENAIQELVRKTLSNHKWLRGGVQFVSEIPKSPSGKILRRKLQQMLISSKM